MKTIYVIMNQNNERDAFYESFTTDGVANIRPSWLNGDYISSPLGATTNDVDKAFRWDDIEQCRAQVDHFNYWYSSDGGYFLHHRYPDSCGQEGYVKYAPKFVVMEMLVHTIYYVVGQR